ncbi:MAG: glycoside hydrolase family 97 protein [Bacteroidia bacterium]|nr:glycoside hydrolase family 97 protein [Bacteroidia bacterium]
MNRFHLYFLAGIILLSACQPSPNAPSTSVSSPDGKLSVDMMLVDNGKPAYLVKKNGAILIDTSTLGLDIAGQPFLGENMTISSASSSEFSETWEMPWGEQRMVNNTYHQLSVDFQEKGENPRSMTLVFRVYNDGLGFRYELPGTDSITIMDERTQFALTSDPMVWWIPGDWDSYEHLYNSTRFSAIDALSKANHPNLIASYIPQNAVNTPVTMKTDDGVYLSFHEAALLDYPGITLKVDPAALSMETELVGGLNDVKAKVGLPFHSPWRSIHIADRAGDLIESNLTVNLNEPNKLGDISDYFTPIKYMGIWWHMHLNKNSWDYASGKHGATTAEAKRMIDYASANGIEGLLVEGWNTGWEHWIGFDDREGVFDFVTPYPDYDLEEVVSYGKEHNVQIIMHHETSAAPRTYDQQMDTAYALMEKLGIHAVKTGYVGPIIPKGEHHHGQWMVQHYHRAELAGAAHKVAVNAHEPIAATGLRRTWPNIIAREGLRGQEFNTWSVEGGNSTEHLTIVPFTRMLSGPIDYTPGIFKRDLRPYRDNELNTTLGHELALYVVIYSPVQMIADLPEHIGDHPGMQFIRDVGVDWEQSKVLDGEVGDFLVMAREERDSHNWFVGAVTDENAREVSVSLDFLPEGKTFTANLYLDGPDAGYKGNLTDLVIETREVKKGDVLTLPLAEGGGAAVSLLAK